MSELKIPSPALLIHSLFFRDASLLGDVLPFLEEKYGKIAINSGILPFFHTNYYEKEFGLNLKRLFVGFAKLVSQDILVQAKLFAAELERRFSLEGKRRINIDPGILSLERLVLATGKNFTHRIYLGEGVFADLTLIFQQGAFQPLPWTFPDYREENLRNMFKTWRDVYKTAIKQGKMEIEAQGE